MYICHLDVSHLVRLYKEAMYYNVSKTFRLSRTQEIDHSRREKKTLDTQVSLAVLAPSVVTGQSVRKFVISFGLISGFHSVIVVADMVVDMVADMEVDTISKF